MIGECFEVESGELKGVLVLSDNLAKYVQEEKKHGQRCLILFRDAIVTKPMSKRQKLSMHKFLKTVESAIVRVKQHLGQRHQYTGQIGTLL